MGCVELHFTTSNSTFSLTLADMRLQLPETLELTPTTATAAAALLALSYLLARAASKSTPPLTGPGGKPLRKIHTLPSTLPVLGNLLDAARRADDRHDWVSELSQQFNGEPFYVKIPGIPDTVVLSTPELFEDVTSTQFDKFIKGDFQLSVIEDLFGRGMVSSDGERWYHQRKAAVKFFSARSLRAFMVHALEKHVKQVFAVLDKAMSDARTVNLSTLFHEFTLQTFVELGVGVDIQCIGAQDPHPFLHAADISPPVVIRRGRLPPFVWKLEKLLKIGPEGEMAKAKEIVYDWVRGVVKQSLDNIARKKQNETTTESTNDANDIKSVVELFAESSHEDTDGLRPEDLVDFLLTFVLAARDTTALSLSWFFYVLAKYPHVEKAIRQEMITNWGDRYGDPSQYLTLEDVRGLTYLEATLKETLRLYSVIPSTRRQATEDTIIGGDVFIRKGENVGLVPYLLARNPNVWGPDASEFKPERWIDAATGEILQVPSSKFFTFSSGPRMCIGMNLAMMELRVVSVNLLNKYRFGVDLATNDGRYAQSFSLAMATPLLASVSWNKVASA